MLKGINIQLFLIHKYSLFIALIYRIVLKIIPPILLY